MTALSEESRLELSRLLGALLASEWKDQSRIRNIEAAVIFLLKQADKAQTQDITWVQPTDLERNPLVR